MKIKFSAIKTTRLYGKQPTTITTLGDSKSPQLGHIVMPVSFDSDFSASLVAKEFIPSMYFKTIYKPRQVSFNGRTKRNNSIQDNYRDIKANSKFSRTVVDARVNKDRNLVYDISWSLDTFNNLFVSKGKMRNKPFMDLLTSYVDNASTLEADSLMLIVDVNDRIGKSTSFESYFNITSVKEPTIVQHLYYYIKNARGKDPILDKLKNHTIIFYSSKTGYFFKLDLNDLNLPRLQKYLRVMLKLNSNIPLDKSEEGEIVSSDKSAAKLDTDNKVDDNKDEAVDLVQDVSNRLAEILNIKKETIKGSQQLDAIVKEIRSEISSLDKQPSTEAELLSYIDTNTNIKKVLQNTSAAVSNVKYKDEETEVEELSIKELLSNFSSKKIIKEDIPLDQDIIYKSLGKSTMKDFEKSYNTLQADADLVAVAKYFESKKDFPMKVKSIQRVDSSDDFNKKNTLTINFEDINGKLHDVKIDMPRMINDRFLFLNNGKKSIVKQMLMLPIVKVKPDTVKITTNYNILHLTRFGSKSVGDITVLSKVLSSSKLQEGIKVTKGSNKSINKEYFCTIDYLEFGELFTRVEFGKYVFITDLKSMKARFESYLAKPEVGEGYSAIGYTKSSTIVINLKTATICEYNNSTQKFTDTGLLFADYLTKKLKESGYEETANKIGSTKEPKAVAYTRVKILNVNIPLLYIIASVSPNGLSDILDRYLKDDYKVILKEDKEEYKTYKNNSLYEKIEFADSYLVYKKKIRYNLLLKSLNMINPKTYEMHELNKQDFYLEFYNDFYGSRNIQKGVFNIIDMLIDPITLDVLKSLNLPTNVIDVLLYANSLLEDNKFSMPNDISNYRIRSNELINAQLYNVIAQSYVRYRQSEMGKRGSTRTAKMSVPQNALLKNLLEDSIVNNFSVLNPFLEMQELGSTTFRGGAGGINKTASLGIESRSYDKSFVGILGLSTPDSDKVGTVRQLSYDANITNTRGIVEIDPNHKDMDTTKMLTPSELLGPLTLSHADPQRAQMFSTQSNHFMPTKKQSYPLMGTGAERTVGHILSDDFVAKAKNDGKVLEINEKLGLMTVQYKDGKKDVIDISDNPSPNSGGGFYITNKKTPKYKVGESFKKNDFLAVNREYFLDNDYNGVTLTNGFLAKVALTSGWFTFEDSCVVTEKLAYDMSSQVTMKKVVKFTPGTNIQTFPKKGQSVKTGDSIIVFEQGFEDSSVNELLDILGKEYEEDIEEMSKNVIKSKYTGDIVDIVIYFNTPIEEMSPSLQNILNSYHREVTQKRDKLEESDNKDDIILPSITQVPEGEKVSGEEFEGVMMEIYTRYEEPMMIGSKLTAAIALKSIIADVIPRGQEPFSDFRRDEPIDIIISPLSIINRMTTEIMNITYGNKVLIELKRQVKSLYIDN